MPPTIKFEFSREKSEIWQAWVTHNEPASFPMALQAFPMELINADIAEYRFLILHYEMNQYLGDLYNLVS